MKHNTHNYITITIMIFVTYMQSDQKVTVQYKNKIKFVFLYKISWA
jgi:hypothetical protein